MSPSRRVGVRTPHFPEPSDLTGDGVDASASDTKSRKSLPDPAKAAASVMLARAIAACGALSGVIVLEVWNAAWSEAVADAWAALVCGKPGLDADPPFPSSDLPPTAIWHVVVCEAKDRRRGDRDAEEAAEALWKGHNVCAVSSSPDRHLPRALVRAADRHVALGPLLPDGLCEAAEAVTGGKPSFALSAAACAAVTPGTLRLARRADQSADDYLRRVAALTETRNATADAPIATLNDLHGMDEAVKWGRDLAADLTAYRTGNLQWFAVDRGCVLVGAPGTGKTIFAQALARACGLPLVSASYARWQAKWDGHLGDLLRAMAETFDEARRAAPCILFIDELDSFHSRTGETRHRDWWTSVVNALLEHLDGVEKREGVVVVGATNHLSMVDPAITRSGRLDRTLRIPMPDQAALAGMLRVHLGRDLEHADLMPVALHAAGATGADCERWVRGARRRARHAGRTMAVDDLLAEVGGVGESRPPDHLGIVAVHEAGHALVLALEQPGALRHASIARRSDSDGQVAALLAEAPIDESALNAILQRLLAGRAAEHVVIGRVTAGSGGHEDSDLAQATRIALAAETALGFSDQPLLWRGLWDVRAIGPVLLGNPHLAERVNTRLEAAWDRVCALLRAHRDTLDEITGHLLARGALGGAEIDRLVALHRSET